MSWHQAVLYQLFKGPIVYFIEGRSPSRHKLRCKCNKFFLRIRLLFCIPFHHGSLTFEKYVPPKFVGFRSKHLRSKDKRGFIGRVTNCQKDKNHNSWNFYNRSKVIPVTWQSIVCSATKKFFHSRQMGQWELISNFPIFQHQYYYWVHSSNNKKNGKIDDVSKSISLSNFTSGAQSLTSLKADIHQDINGGFAFSRCLNGTFPWRNCSVKTLVH